MLQTSERRTRLELTALGLLVVAVWLLQHPYAGIKFDAHLYALLGLARLHPQSLANDVFLRFGSQDRYTLFGPIYAGAIRFLDLEPAAALGTLVSQAAFLGGAWLLARRLMPARQALFALGLLAALPDNYGMNTFFGYLEDFLTPRTLAEAFVLAGLAAIFAGRRLAGGLSVLAALLLHPIMGFAGIALLFCLYVAIPKPRLAAALVAASLLLSLVPILVLPTEPFAPFDGQWFDLIHGYTPYLFVLQWPLDYWGRISVSMAVLAVGAVIGSSLLARTLCGASLAMAAGGILLTLLYSDLLHSRIFTQMQPWRWLWLADVIAVVCLPVVLGDCWRGNWRTRSAAALLVCAWILRNDPLALYVAGSAVILSIAVIRTTPPRLAQYVFVGCCVLAGVVALLNIAEKLSYVPVNNNGATPTLLAETLRTWLGDGVLPAAALALAWWVLGRRFFSTVLLVNVVAAAGCGVLLPLAWQAWTHFYFTSDLHAAFARWRSAIPENAQVLWPTTPLGSWYLLERASYYSLVQVSGDIFSKAKALEIHRRAAEIEAALEISAPSSVTAATARANASTPPVLPADTHRMTARGLASACGDPELDFVVSWNPLLSSPFPPVAPDPTKPRQQLHLYRCADVRTGVPIGSRPDVPSR